MLRRGSWKVTSRANSGARTSSASEPGHAFLVLTDVDVEGGLAEERAEVPPRHAEALLDVAPGRIGYERSRLPLGEGLEAGLSRFLQPSGLDVVTVVVDGDPETFAPPAMVRPGGNGRSWLAAAHHRVEPVRWNLPSDHKCGV